MNNIFDLSGKKALVTGAAGLLGPKHSEALLEFGASVVLTDVDPTSLERVYLNLESRFPGKVYQEIMDVTDESQILKVSEKHPDVSILINNAAKDPKVTKDSSSLNVETRFENMGMDFFKEGVDAIIFGTFLTTRIICNSMLKNGGGVVLNISSDLGVIAPDQRIYRDENLPDHLQPVKPITYSAAKWAVIGMTKYLGVYFADKNIRVNCLSPTGVYNNHPEEFVKRLSNIIPMGRMADIDEYKGAVVFLCSDASTYMTGSNLIIDGGKTVW